MGVGVVALERAVFEPEHPVLGQPAGQGTLQLAPVDPRMALAQALPGGQQAALAVGFDGTTFQSKINGLPCTIREDSNLVQAFDEQVVLAGIELPAPAGKAEVEQAE